MASLCSEEFRSTVRAWIMISYTDLREPLPYLSLIISDSMLCLETPFTLWANKKWSKITKITWSKYGGDRARSTSTHCKLNVKTVLTTDKPLELLSFVLYSKKLNRLSWPHYNIGNMFPHNGTNLSTLVNWLHFHKEKAKVKAKSQAFNWIEKWHFQIAELAYSFTMLNRHYWQLY